MRHVIKAEAEQLKRERSFFRPPQKAASQSLFGAKTAASILALAMSILSAPLHAQGAGLAPGLCDASLPGCPAPKQALAEGAARRAQQTAQAQPAPRAGDAVPGLGGLAMGNRAVANALANADDATIRFGMIAPFSGANKDFASELKLGVETAFAAANEGGGVNGKSLRLFAADDGYDPARTPDLAKSLYEKDHIFGFISNFGTATSTAILPYVLERKLIFFGAFSGAGVLRKQPPDRYVFNYRPSYAEETEAVVRYLVKVQRLKPEQIAVFAQDDAFGEAGYAGVEKAIRTLDETGAASILHMRYARNSIDVAAALDDLRKHREAKARHKPLKAVVMVATYRAAAKFVEKTRDIYPDLIYTDVSAVGSNNFADELKLLGPRYANGIIVTQVVPDPDGFSSIALEYRTALNKYYPTERPDYVSFESYLNAKIMLDGLKQAGPQADSDKLVNALENIHNLDMGLGATVEFAASEHQAIHKVWGTQLDETGQYHFIDLE